MDIILETEGLVIRRWTPEDAEAAFAIYGDPEVTRHLGGEGPETSVEQTRAMLERVIAREARMPGFGFWAVAEKATGRLVGGALLQGVDETPEIEVGYHLGRGDWGKGYATEMARALVRYGFETMGLDRIIGLVFPENHASRRVLEKAGLVYEGRGVYFGHELDVFAITAPASQRG